ncbi:non-classical arabinogalactan protein 30 [Medicago truncatula]|uniref:non-classical arabinogalactan protein 30 n=1 Tax=Medicago truncatula TaxID=3880 RepID=UPI000D2F31AD|nr:non-classical arabinogalactan protein 30 [Medicago truncatula]
MTKALAFLLLLLQLTSFSAFAEDTSDTFNDIFDFDADDDALNAFSKDSLPSPPISSSFPPPTTTCSFSPPSLTITCSFSSPPISRCLPSPPISRSFSSPSPSPSPRHQSSAPSPHHQSPAPSPHHQSTIVPAKPPTHHHPPAHSPSPLRPTPVPRSVMVVRGVVYVKSCNYSGFDTLKKATPLLGPVVKLQCNNTKYKLDETDKDGHFSLVGPKIITIYTAKQCDVVLVSAPHGLKPSNLHNGITGVILRPKRRFVSKGVPFILFGTQPLAFEPSCPH